jgi:hypothetical protein
MPVAEAILRLGHALYHDPAIDVEYAGTGSGYFMAQEDQDAVLCRTVLEHREAKEHEARLDKEAKRKGYSLKDQAHMPHFLGDRLFRNSDYRTWKENQTAYGRTPRIGREEHSLGGAALAGLLRIRIWEAAFNSTSFLLSSSSLST